MRLSGAPRRLVAALAARCGCRPSVDQLRSRPWASATFTGARHRLALRFSGAGAKAAADRLADGLEEAEFDLGPDLLVDITIVDRTDALDEVAVAIEALTIESD